MPPPNLPPRPRILVVSLRRIGDVLLTTPLIRSLRRAWPQASIDVLVFDGCTGILVGNPDIDRVISMPQRPGSVATIRLLARLWKRYDLAVSTQSGDSRWRILWSFLKQSRRLHEHPTQTKTG